MEKTYAFGVDLGGTTVKIGLFTGDGILDEKWEIPTRTENRSHHLLSDIAESMIGRLNERKIPLRTVKGVGLGVPGCRDRRAFCRTVCQSESMGRRSCGETVCTVRSSGKGGQ